MHISVTKRASWWSIRTLALQAYACFPFERIEQLVDSIRTARLRRRLAFCGARTVISSGLFAERPDLIHLGDDVSLGPNISMTGVGGIFIRDGAMLATRTLILTTQHDPTSEFMARTSVHGKVEIGEFAWIGAGAILLPGVTVGRHAVIAAGAVVTKDIPPYALALGVPARVLRDRRAKPVATRHDGAACCG